nr:zinc finger, CCHC-type [Tanacetum cinerariifolium]
MVESDKNDSTSSNTTVRELGNVLLQCPKLTETNYTTWALMMETIMKAYGIWETIVAKEGVTTNEKKGNTSKAIIFQTLPQDALIQVAQYTTAKEVWNSIKIKHLGADLVQKARLQTLRSELETLRIKPNEKVSDFEGKLRSIKAKFKGLGENLEDKILVRKLFNFAPKKFLPIVATTKQYQDLDEMSFEEAIGRLTTYEERIKSQDTLEANDQDKLLMVSSNNKTYGKWRGKDFNKEGKDNMKWKNNPNACRASTSQGTKDKSKLSLERIPAFRLPLMILVDLARTERQEATGATGERQKEARHINRPLTQLGNMSNILAEVSQTGKKRYIPYRDSKLRVGHFDLFTYEWVDLGTVILMIANQNQGDPRTEWNSCRSLYILKFTLHYPMILPHINDDKDVEMKIVDEERKCCKELRGTTDGHGRPSTYSLIIHKLTEET